MTDAVTSSTLSRQVQLAVRPGEAVSLPGVCVACENAATAWMPVSKRQGQLTRTVEVPVCTECARQSKRRSGREEQLRRIRWLATGLAAVGLFVLGWLLAGGVANVLWQLAAGLATAAVGVAIVWWAFGRAIEAAELPEKRAVTESVRIVGFSGRKMTLAFSRDGVAATVAELNQQSDVEDHTPDPAAGD